MMFSKHWKIDTVFFQTLENRRLAAMVAMLWLSSFVAFSQSSLLDTGEYAHLTHALARLDMTPVDLGFEKDVGKPEWVMERNRRLLDEPLLLADYGAHLLRAVTNGPEAVWEWMAHSVEAVFEGANVSSLADEEMVREMASLDPALRMALAEYLRAVRRAEVAVKAAFADISREEREYGIASLLCDFFRVEDFPARESAVTAVGVSSAVVYRVLQEAQDIYPEPEARAFLSVARKVRIGLLLAAARDVHEAVEQLAERAQLVARWPADVVRAVTPAGVVVIGTTNHDVHAGPAVLILDGGGNDQYGDDAGAGNGLSGSTVSVVLDLSGHDVYRSRALLGAGAAVLGISIVRDEGGDDVYESVGLGQGAALFGVGWMDDMAGYDVYRAGVVAQGAAWCGAGVLCDAGGEDRYDVGMCGQGYAGVQGVGLLLDVAGNDLYYAGGREPDFERNDDRFVSLAQGFAIGLRPFAGGGTGAIVDLAGNDEYIADVYGQGVSYWYSLGMLLDAAGNDRYTVHQYGQGTGIHLSAGLLADLGGHDAYRGAILGQGSAHDYAVGMLIEKRGDDVYVGRQHAQGRALNNALAILLDAEGRDTYFAYLCDECQGIGNDGDKREYGSLALLLDLSGADFYTCGGHDGDAVERPSFGVIYDVSGEVTP